MTVSGMNVQSCMERLHQRNEELVFHVHISYYKCLQIIITLYELFTYLVASSQDFFRVFPHAKNVEIADDNVQPVPCVLLVVILLFFINIISFLLTKISRTSLESR